MYTYIHTYTTFSRYSIGTNSAAERMSENRVPRMAQ